MVPLMLANAPGAMYMIMLLLKSLQVASSQSGINSKGSVEQSAIFAKYHRSIEHIHWQDGKVVVAEIPVVKFALLNEFVIPLFSGDKPNAQRRRK